MTGGALPSKPDDLVVTVQSLRLEGDAAKVKVELVPWWQKGDEPVALQFQLNGVREIELKQPTIPFETTEFGVTADDPLLWNFGARSTIFGIAPLPDPYRFFLEFYRVVQRDLKLRRDPTEYLNWRSGMSDWLELVYSRAYNLLTAPTAVVDAAVPLLEAQVADFQVLPLNEPTTLSEPRLLYFGDSWIVADEIAVEKGVKKG